MQFQTCTSPKEHKLRLKGRGGGKNVVKSGGETNTSFSKLHVDARVVLVVVRRVQHKAILDVCSIDIDVRVGAGKTGRFVTPNIRASNARAGRAQSPLSSIGSPRSLHLGNKVLSVLTLITTEIVIHVVINDPGIPDNVQIVVVSKEGAGNVIATLIRSEASMKRLVNVTNEVSNEFQGILNSGRVGKGHQLLCIVEDGTGNADIIHTVARVLKVAGPIRGIDVVEGSRPFPAGLVFDIISPVRNIRQTLIAQNIAHCCLGSWCQHSLSNTGCYSVTCTYTS